MTTYHLAIFPLAVSLADEELYGYSMIGLVGAIFTANLGIIIVVTI